MTSGAREPHFALTRGRTELKYLVAPATGVELERRFDQQLGRHRYAGHGANTLPLARHFTTTIYFDTPKRELFHATHASTHLKLRARQYYDVHPELVEVAIDLAEIVRDQPVLWLELKERDGTESTKRRIGLPKRDVAAFLRSREPSAEMLAIQRAAYGADAEAEIEALTRFLSRFDDPLEASCIVNYRRTSWETGDGSLRITLDRDLAAFAPPRALFVDTRPLVREALGVPCVRESRLIVEVKRRSAAPSWLERALGDAGEPAEGYSKFRIASIAVHGSGRP